MDYDPYENYLNNYSRKLKQSMTKAECCLWKYALKSGLRHGLKFRRQRPIGEFIVDFVSIELKLVIEVDGITHTYESVVLSDQKKEQYLISRGYKVVRYSDDEILTGINRVIEHLDDIIVSLLRETE